MCTLCMSWAHTRLHMCREILNNLWSCTCIMLVVAFNLLLLCRCTKFHHISYRSVSKWKCRHVHTMLMNMITIRSLLHDMTSLCQRQRELEVGEDLNTFKCIINVIVCDLMVSFLFECHIRLIIDNVRSYPRAYIYALNMAAATQRERERV